MNDASFENRFLALTGRSPFPWQGAFYDRLVQNDIPRVCSLPTGLGKTSVVPIWLLALANHPDKMPRRLVYVVNRRTVVDQTTNEVENLRRRLESCENEELVALNDCVGTLAISTLRGQFADNQEWSADPSRPAVICGTVDMIGSRLLFSGYRIGFKSRPLHAGFLGQDVLLVHDEAHLEPAFQDLVEAIEREQESESLRSRPNWPQLRVLTLSATTREQEQGSSKPFTLKSEDYAHPVVRKRISAKKALELHVCEDEKKQLANQLAELALAHQDSDEAILVFARRVDDALAILAQLEKACPNRVAPLTGTMRGYERDELVRSNPVFARFMPTSDRSPNVEPTEGTVYLVCTSAGEVGINLSADTYAVCDLSTIESMAQRLGRVNRFGEGDATIDVVYPAKFDDKDALTLTRQNTLKLLEELPRLPEANPGDIRYDASPKAFEELRKRDNLPCKLKDAFTPEPDILPTTEILFDVWAMTTIREKMPGRPPVAPYLHGVAEWEPPRTSVAWRSEVDIIVNKPEEDDPFASNLLDRYPPTELLEDYPLKPHELLSDTSERVYKAIELLQKRIKNDCPLWIVDQEGKVDPTSFKKLFSQEKKQILERIADCAILLPPQAGGLTTPGMLDGKSEYNAEHPHGYDIADKWLDEEGGPRRARKCSDDPQASGPMKMALIRTIDKEPLADDVVPHEEEEDSREANGPDTEAESSTRKRFWHWYARPHNAEDATRASLQPISWDHHTKDVVQRAEELVKALGLSDELKRAVIFAAELHDLGKQRELWQRGIGNPNPTNWYAKPGKPDNGPRWRPRSLSPYRHEFGSLLDILAPNQEYLTQLNGFSDEMRDLVLHLIATHHGYARPHFPRETTVDPNHAQLTADTVALEVIRRYVRLQRRYGRWGLAYLESLLRAADWAASATPSPIN